MSGERCCLIRLFRSVLSLSLCLSLSALASGRPDMPDKPAQSEKPPATSPSQELDALEAEGQRAYRSYDFANAEKAWQSGLQKANATSDRSRAADFLMDLAEMYTTWGRGPQAQDSYLRAIALYKALGDTRAQGRALENLGNFYDRYGFYPKALDYHQQALALREPLGNKRDIADTLDDTGLVYYHLGQFKQALEFHTCPGSLSDAGQPARSRFLSEQRRQRL